MIVLPLRLVEAMREEGHELMPSLDQITEFGDVILSTLRQRRAEMFDAIVAGCEAYCFGPLPFGEPKMLQDQKFWMVLGPGKPTKRHTSHKDAIDEAERLAMKHPGTEFVVLESKFHMKAEVKYTMLKTHSVNYYLGA